MLSIKLLICHKHSTPGYVAFLEMLKNITSSAVYQIMGTWLVCKGLLSHRNNESPISIAKRRSNFCPVDSCRLALGWTLCAYLDLSSILISRDQIWRDHVRYHLCVKNCQTVLRKPDGAISWARRHSLHPLSSFPPTTQLSLTILFIVDSLSLICRPFDYLLLSQIVSDLLTAT